MRNLVALFAAVVFGVTVAQPAASAPDWRDGVVLVFGDSITSRYTDDPGDPMQGWWSKLAAERNLYPVTSAQGGGGLIKKGDGCNGTAVRERSGAVIDRVKPDEIWIAVGKNDTRVCINGVAVKISPSFRERAATAAFAKIATEAVAAGVDLRNVYVTVPWGTSGLSYRKSVVLTFASASRAAGLTFINVPRMDTTMTRDGTHPNAKGNAYIADVFGGKMSPHFKPDPVPGPPPEVTSVR